MAKITQLVSSGAGIQTQAVGSESKLLHPKEQFI